MYRASRGRGAVLYIVEDDNSRSTARCARDTRDHFIDDFDSILIVSSARGAQDGDIVTVIDQNTGCKRMW